MLEKLTPEQEALLPVYAKRWREIGLSTEPANRPEAERGIALAYEAAGLPAPQVVWFDSPMAMLLKRGEPLAFGEKKWEPVWNQVRDQVREQAWTMLTGRPGASLTPDRPHLMPNGQRAGAMALDGVMARVRKLLRKQVQGQVEAPVWKQVGAQVEVPVRAQVWEQVGAQVREPIREQIAALVGDQTKRQVWDAYYDCAWGQHDAEWLAVHAYFRDACGLMGSEPLLGITLLSENAGWYLPYRHVCYVSERPYVLKQDEQGRLHGEDGPALAYPDGWGVYAIHGVRVPKQVILRPETITVAQIEGERNTEVRRVMVDRYGPDRYLVDSGARLVHQDDYGSLFSKEQDGDEPLLMVKVVNSTPEPHPGPNGETPYFKDYWLRVPPYIQTAHEGVAWTFGLTPGTYHPSLQT